MCSWSKKKNEQKKGKISRKKNEKTKNTLCSKHLQIVVSEKTEIYNILIKEKKL